MESGTAVEVKKEQAGGGDRNRRRSNITGKIPRFKLSMLISIRITLLVIPVM